MTTLRLPSAALCLALSQLHIWYGQSMQPYALTDLLPLLSAYALLRASREGNPCWWAVHLAANVLCIWTHLFLVFFFGVEWVYLVLFHHRNHKMLFAWCVVHVVLVLPAFLWVYQMVAYVAEAEYDHYTRPSARDILIDFVGDDAFKLSNEFPVSDETWKFLPARAADALMAARRWFDLALMAFLLTCFIWLCLQIRRAVRRKPRRGDPAAPAADTAGMTLLALLALLPIMEMVAVSYLWRPCLGPRYTTYSSLALYAAAGGAIMSVRRPALRALAFIVLIALYTYQLSLMLPAVTRTPWLSAARQIKAEGSPADRILVTGLPPMALHIFRANMEECDIPMAPAYGIQTICEDTAAFLDRGAVSGSNTPAPKRVWAVIEGTFQDPVRLVDRFDAYLRPLGITLLNWTFFGMQNVYLFAFFHDPNAQGAPLGTPVTAAPNMDYAAVLKELGGSYADKTQEEVAVHALRRIMDYPWPAYKMPFTHLSLILSEDGRAPDLAARAARFALAKDPNFPYGHFALGIALAEMGNEQTARAEFDKAFELDPMCMGLFRPFIEALYETKDRKAAALEMERLHYLESFSDLFESLLKRH